MLVTLNEVLKDAQQKHYAVGLFNTVNLEMAQGVIGAAEEAKSPVIIGTAEVLLPAAELKELAPLLRSMAQRASVPVVLHFDHGLTEAKINEAIDLGFSSIMYDCSAGSLEDNVKNVAAMVRKAHSLGLSVEGELGHVGANAEEKGDNTIYTEPDQAKAYWEATGVDALAIAIGTAHGAYKSTPKLDLDRLTEIRNTVDVPLVLHGGSGLSDDDFRNTIARGIAKINIFTDLNVAAAKAAYDAYQKDIGLTSVMPFIREAVKQETLKKMNLFGSVGKA